MDDTRALALQLAITTLGESATGPNEVLSLAWAYVDFLQGKEKTPRFLIKTRMGWAAEGAADPDIPPNSEPHAIRPESGSPDELRRA